MALDIGPASVEAVRGAVQRARTVFWNGPMGVFEKPGSRRAPSRWPTRWRRTSWR
jgi:phosphoglycerate kinase